MALLDLSSSVCVLRPAPGEGMMRHETTVPRDMALMAMQLDMSLSESARAGGCSCADDEQCMLKH